MGTDYYLADPEAKEVTYIDRCGVSFSICNPDRVEVPGWPHGPVRLLTRAVFDEIGSDGFSEMGYPLETFWALAWCAGRRTVVLIDDHCLADEASHDFCFAVAHGDGVAGWKVRTF